MMNKRIHDFLEKVAFLLFALTVIFLVATGMYYLNFPITQSIHVSERVSFDEGDLLYFENVNYSGYHDCDYVNWAGTFDNKTIVAVCMKGVE